MKLHSVFLRDDCVLPSPLNPLRAHFGEHWSHVEEISASVFDTMIRQAGWHFIWVSGSCSRRGCARTQAKAIENALGRALGAVSKQSNAADFDSVHVTKYLGFHVANVTVQRRRIQQHPVLEADDGDRPRANSTPDDADNRLLISGLGPASQKIALTGRGLFEKSTNPD